MRFVKCRYGFEFEFRHKALTLIDRGFGGVEDVVLVLGENARGFIDILLECKVAKLTNGRLSLTAYGVEMLNSMDRLTEAK